MHSVPVRAAVLGALFAALMTLPGLGNGTLWDNSETVYGEVAREVLLTHDWVVMHLNEAAWFVQPPLFFWVAAISAKLFGIGAFAMRLPAALATVGMGAVLGFATARVAGTRAGTLAALVLSTCLMQAILGRLAVMDALLNLCIVVAMLCWFRAFGERAHGGAFVAGAVALAFGTLTKGPVAPVIVVLVIAVWLVWEARSSAAIAWPAPATWALAAVAFVAIVAPWFVLEGLRVGPSALGTLIGHYTIGRYTGVIENQSGPWWYYVPVVILGFFPWIAFVPVAALNVIDAARTRAGSLERLALVWAVVPFLFFSCAQTKLPNYIALIMPALAIVVALWFDRALEARDRRAALWSALAVPLVVAALVIAAALFMRSNHLEDAIAIVVPQAHILGVVMLGGSLATVAVLAAPRANGVAPYVLGATSAAFVLFIAFVGEPAAEALKPIPAIARVIQEQRAPGSVVAIRGVPGAYALMFYAQPGIVSVDESESLGAVCAGRDLFLVTRAADVAGLETIAAEKGRDALELGRLRGVSLLHVRGPAC